MVADPECLADRGQPTTKQELDVGVWVVSFVQRDRPKNLSWEVREEIANDSFRSASQQNAEREGRVFGRCHDDFKDIVLLLLSGNTISRGRTAP